MLSPIQSMFACEVRLAKGSTAAVPANRLPATKRSGHRRIPSQCNVGQAHGLLRPAHSPASGLPARSDQYLSYASAGQGDRLRGVSQAGDPENFRVAAEPGPLTLGVLARFELSRCNGLFQ